MMQTSYQKKRSYRTGKTPATIWLIQHMNARFERDFDDYWQQFGYEIGGPVCYAYTKWFSDLIDECHPEMTDLAFVARDGWILKQVYEKLPHRSKAKSYYIYAPRSVNLQSQSDEGRGEYQKYLRTAGVSGGEIGVVDTVTMKFSSQRLIDSVDPGKTHGFFWCVLDHTTEYGKNFSYSAYQKEGYHIIRNWNVMEFIMTSPEPPILRLQNGTPIYRTPTPSEQLREKLFTSMESGILEFIEDVCAAGEFPQISNTEITEWVNDFLKNPTEEDLRAFKPIRFSEREDHSDNIALDPFGQDKKPFLKSLKDRIWFWSQRHKRIYAILRFGKSLLKHTLFMVQSIGCAKYNGKNETKLIEKLSQYDVVSFDVFDTLIFREVGKPTDLFYRLENQNGLLGFHDNRILSEVAARRNSGKANGEVNLFDIYQELSKHYMLDIKKEVNEEIAAEKAVCYANPAMKELYQLLVSKGCRIIAVSDMYIPGKWLRKLLDNCGYTNIERVFVSCDHGVGKENGSLQKLVQSELGDDLKFIHIGDNQTSDVQGSKMAGWSAVWYRK